MLITQYFSGTLQYPFRKGDIQLPLFPSDAAKLAALLEDGDYTYLLISDPVSSEIIKVTRECGFFVSERAQDGTMESNFPKGACVTFTMSPAVVKELICTHDCCADVACPCEPVASAGYNFSTAKLNIAWTGSVIFTGDLPMTIAVGETPAWMEVEQFSNYLKLSGTPAAVGTVTLSVAATNCSGEMAVQQCTLTVTT